MPRIVGTFIVATLVLLAPLAGAEESADYSKLESVQAFDQFMANVTNLRNIVLEDAANEREASEGMRFLLRTIAMSSDVTGDVYPMAPHFARMDRPRRKVGGDNPDGEYDNLGFMGSIDYVITGNVGTVDHLSFTVLDLQANGRSKQLGYVNERTLEPDADGNFTLWLTAEKPKDAGVWIKTGGGVGNVLVRQYIGDRSTEELATYSVRAVGRERFDPLPPSTDAEVAGGIRGAQRAFDGLARLHRYVQPSIDAKPNEFLRRNSDDFGADISSPDNLYLIGTYGIAEDEALVIEVEPLDVRFWNFAIESPWHESVDYEERMTSRTHDAVTVDPDGKIRFLLAHARADHPNYLETGGHSRGFMTFRWVGERDTKAPLPTVTKLPLAEAIAQTKSLGGR